MALPHEFEPFEQVLSCLPLAVMTTDSTGIVRWANAAFCRLTGFSTDELVGRHVDTLHEEAKARPLAVIHALNPGESWKGRAVGRRKDGTLYGLEETVTSMGSGSLSRMVWTVTEAGTEEPAAGATEAPAPALDDAGIERRYRALYDSMLEGVAIYKMIYSNGAPSDCVIVDVNRRFEEILGLKREDVLNRPISESYGENARPLLNKFTAMPPTASPYQYEIEFPLIERRISISTAPLGGDLFATVFFDVTQQRTTEEQLRAISENSADVIWMWSLATHKVVYSTPSVQKLRGITVEEAMAQSLNQMMPPRMLNRIQPEFVRRIAAVEAGEERARVGIDDIEFLRKDGSLVATETVTTLLCDDNGKATFLVGVTRDATEQRQLQKALRESENKFARTFFSSPAMTVLSDLDAGGRLIEVNEAFEQFFGYRSDEVVGRTAAELHLWSGDDREELLRRLRTTGKVSSFEAHFRKKNTDIVTGLVSAELIELNGRSCMLIAALDITERNRTEAALRKSEQQLSKIFQSSPAIKSIHDLDHEGRFVEVNDAFVRELGYSRDDLIGRTIPETGIWVDEDLYPRILAQMNTAGSVQNLEHQFRTKDGQIGTGLVSAEVLELDGRRYAISASLVITDRKRAEEALRRSEERLRLTLDAADLVAYEFNVMDGAHHEAGPVDRLFGQARGFRHESLEALAASIHPADRERVMGIAAAALRGEGDYEVEFRVPLPEGGEKWLAAKGTLLRNAEGKPWRLLGVAMDISERKRTEEALIQTNLRLQLAAASGELGIWEWDVASRKLVWDDRMLQLYEISRQQFAGYDSWLNCLHPDDRAGVIEAFEASIRGERRYDEGYRVVLPDGQVRHIKAHGLVVRDVDGKPVRMIGLNRDVTAIRRAVEEQERLQAQLVQSQKMESIGRLAGGVAHDFNNLLTVINGYSILALGELRPADPLRRYVEEIHKAGERATELTKQLLAFSRKQVMQPHVLSLNSVVGGLRSMLERLVGEDVEVRVSLDPEDPMVLADPHQLEQVIMNLAVNGRDAMPDGGSLFIGTGFVVRDEAYAKLHPDVNGGRYAMVSVSDTGMGMDEATRQRIFEPFFTTKGAGKGTGLGLSMVQGIVAQSGGHIDVLSAPAMGTTFKIFLPALAAAKPEVQESVPATLLSGRESILVVEDQEDVRNYAVEVLKGYGYHVIPAASPGEALSICEQRGDHFDMVLSDVVMPHMSGRELVTRLTQVRTGLKALFMSGYADDIVVRQGLLTEGAQFIQKPFAPEELAAKVRMVLGGPPATARILVADDEAAVRSYLRAVLEDAGYRVTEVANGKQALNETINEDVDLLITDIVMPEQDGIETIQALHRSLPGVAMIAISGAFGGQFLKVAKMLGADAVLEKPVNAELLLATVSQVLASRQK